MFWRKLLFIPTRTQIYEIKAEVDLIMQRCDKIAQNENDDEKMAKKHHDGQCPKCKHDIVVDRFADVRSKGKLNGSFKFGFGKIENTFIIETGVVNHCNKCGHEWKKYEFRSASSTDIVRVALKYFVEILENPEEKRKEWKVEAIQVFDGCYAEAIWAIRNHNNSYLKAAVSRKLTLWQLRKYYPSIFDSKNNHKELKKLL